jgi:hypothetical protein
MQFKRQHSLELDNQIGGQLITLTGSNIGGWSIQLWEDLVLPYSGRRK